MLLFLITICYNLISVVSDSLSIDDAVMYRHVRSISTRAGDYRIQSLLFERCLKRNGIYYCTACPAHVLLNINTYIAPRPMIECPNKYLIIDPCEISRSITKILNY